jgi:hypothetical protein
VSELPEVIVLSPEEEAVRLWRGAQEEFRDADSSLVALCGSLELGIRAAENLVIQLLQPVRQKFTSTIALRLELPAPTVDAYRDAMGTPQVLEFTEMLDLLSEEHLECVAPSLHRGWEDRAFACLRSRATAQEALGLTIGPEPRENLLLLSAYRNRIFRYSPPIRVVPSEIIDAYDDLVRVVEHLLRR